MTEEVKREKLVGRLFLIEDEIRRLCELYKSIDVFPVIIEEKSVFKNDLIEQVSKYIKERNSLYKEIKKGEVEI